MEFHLLELGAGKPDHRPHRIHLVDTGPDPAHIRQELGVTPVAG
ncbi:hypothetical protein ACFXKG_34295 [Streptomyces sp. NPDC059255]